MMERSAVAAFRAKRTAVHFEFSRFQILQRHRMSRSIPDIITGRLAGIGGGMIPPALLLRIEFDVLAAAFIIAVVDVNMIKPITHVFDRVWKDAVSLRKPAILVLINEEFIMVFAVVLHRVNQQAKDF